VLILDLAEGREVGRGEKKLEGILPLERAAELKKMDVDLLLCGAISRPFASALAIEGINLMSFLSGEAESVISAYLSKKLYGESFQMPGCGWGARRRMRGSGERKGPFGCQRNGRKWDW
jgi:hypothetical protein